MIKTVMLTGEDLRTSDVLTRLVGKKIKVKEAMKLLCLSERQVLRKKAKFIQYGVASIPHQNKGKITSRAISQADKDQIVRLYQSEYYGWNFSHFFETIKNEGHTSLGYKSVSRILLSRGISSPHSNRKHKKIHPPRKRKESAGELIQVDASCYQWLYQDTSYYHLHGGIDDATGTVVGVYLEQQETIHGYQMILAQMIKNYGLPACWYSDFRTIFQSQKQTLTIDEEPAGKHLEATKFHTVLEKLGINLISTTCPQAKGKIERLWKTFQDRLTKELAKLKVKDLSSANEFIQNQFLPAFNNRFALPIDESKNMFVAVTDDFDYNHQLATHQMKTIHHQCYLKHDSQYLVVVDPVTKKPASLSTRRPVKLYTLLDGTKQVEYQHQFFRVKTISIAQIKQQIAIATTAPLSTIKSRPIKSALLNVKPAPNHPWRNGRNWLKTRNINYQRIIN